MSRGARELSESGMYHIRCKSYKEAQLFKDDEDKEVYLNLLKLYQEIFMCSIYSYTLMSNHVHLFIDAKGFSISKFMHSLNYAYAKYYKSKYERDGSVFLGRYKSTVVKTANYATTLATYIHKNSKDIEGFFGCEENYVYSSYGVYAGLHEDTRELLDVRFMKGLFQIENDKEFHLAYYQFVKNKEGIYSYNSNIDITTIETDKVSFERTFIESEIIDEVKENFDNVNVEKDKLSESEYLIIYFLRAMCCYTYNDICRLFVKQKVEDCLMFVKRGLGIFKSQIRAKNIFYGLLEKKFKIDLTSRKFMGIVPS